MAEIVGIVLSWAKTQPANNLLTAALVALLAGMGYFQWDDAVARRKSTAEAHEMVHNILKARDEHEKEEQTRTDRQNERVINALMGVKTSVDKVPVATAAAATKIVKGQLPDHEAKESDDKPDEPGL